MQHDKIVPYGPGLVFNGDHDELLAAMVATPHLCHQVRGTLVLVKIYFFLFPSDKDDHIIQQVHIIHSMQQNSLVC